MILLWIEFFFYSIFSSIFLIYKSHSFYRSLQRYSINFFNFLRWTAIRCSYFTNNWIYTTNHKRIGVNYFNFILVSGTAGMALATVMRIEFSYPGVGILLGDSLQYLSIATGHGVIMVFFMIMPVLFGAFANFLLPTQLGVHDVAFPRLNSAAFWFLPGGLIMLLHIVCVDRRYQRMNIFSMRELESVLKRRYFKDLINTNDHRELLDNSMIGLRYKTNSTLNTESNIHLFYNYGTTISPKSKSQLFNNPSNSNLNINYNYIQYYLNLPFMDILSLNNITVSLNFIKNTLLNLPNALFTIPFSIKSIIDVITVNLSINFNVLSLFNNFYYSINTNNVNITNNNNSYTFKTDNIQKHDLFTAVTSSSFEMSNHFRFLTFHLPRIGLDFKRGNYMAFWEFRYPMTFMTDKEVCMIKKTLKFPWFFHSGYDKQIMDFYESHDNLFSSKNLNFLPTFDSTKRLEKKTKGHNFQCSNILPIDSFFNFYRITSSEIENLNLRWVAFNNLNQKFYSMFNTNSTQQRLLSKWRELKFTREAWRCKMLLARNQNTFFRKQVNEEGITWSIERNAKDLLPGWAMITPFSARPRFTLLGKVDIGLMAVFLALNASIVSSANFLVTYRYLSTLNNRKMRDARSFFSESTIVSSWMMVAANPMLAIGILMLISDRHWRTSFFDYSGGGDAVLFQHMFWFFGHPEVYVIMIPVFGFANTIMSYYLRKRISARASLMYSMYTIAFLGFWVWGHHMYMVGLSHTTRMLFSTLTVMISVPAATKLMHWCVTIVNSTFVMELPLLFTLIFIFMFVSGGISGMAVAHTGMDVLFHDTFYVIGHFHVMLAGAGMMGIFGAFYFYFPAIYGVKYSRIYAYIHFVYYLFGQLLTVIPMMWLGYCGMPRRVFDYPYVLGGWHAIATSGHLLSVAALISFFIMIYDSVRQAKPAIRKTFGPARFNTRLNFFLYESYRVSYIQRRSFFFNRTPRKTIYKDRLFKHLQIVNMEINLFSYNLIKR